MQTPSSEHEITQFERALKSLTMATWNRTRSDDELTSFIDRRHAALADIEL